MTERPVIWCMRCGVEYESALQPACECAGDPPIDRESADYRKWKERVQGLRHDEREHGRARWCER